MKLSINARSLDGVSLAFQELERGSLEASLPDRLDKPLLEDPEIGTVAHEEVIAGNGIRQHHETLNVFDRSMFGYPHFGFLHIQDFRAPVTIHPPIGIVYYSAFPVPQYALMRSDGWSIELIQKDTNAIRYEKEQQRRIKEISYLAFARNLEIDAEPRVSVTSVEQNQVLAVVVKRR